MSNCLSLRHFGQGTYFGEWSQTLGRAFGIVEKQAQTACCEVNDRLLRQGVEVLTVALKFGRSGSEVQKTSPPQPMGQMFME